MRSRATILTLGLTTLLACASCKSHEPTPEGGRPTIESLDPPDGCFPRRQPDNRGNPPAATLPATSRAAS